MDCREHDCRRLDSRELDFGQLDYRQLDSRHKLIVGQLDCRQPSSAPRGRSSESRDQLRVGPPGRPPNVGPGLAMDVKIILTPLCITIPLVILNTNYTGRRQSDFNVYAYPSRVLAQASPRQASEDPPPATHKVGPASARWPRILNEPHT